MPLPAARIRRGARVARALAFCGVLVAPGAVFAHGLGISQIHLRVDEARIEGDWDLDLRDARRMLGLDPGLAGEAALRELRAHEAQLRSRMIDALEVAADSVPCRVTLADTPMTWNAEEGFVRFRVMATCPAPPGRLTLGSKLFFDLDPTHRTYFSVEDARAISAGVLRNDLRAATFPIQGFDLSGILLEFIREGMWHIWNGLDHLLFLVALLLPAPLVRAGGAWAPRTGLWPTTVQVFKVVTAFTLAHSVTLALSFFGVIVPPSHWVETTIALSVFAAAWNNLRPFLPGRAWLMALGFGLVHGLGFAGALKNLSLPRRAAGAALGAFNVGVELGQLAIVAVVLPALYLASRRGIYPRWVMGLGSLLIAWLAMVWSLERGIGLRLFR